MTTEKKEEKKFEVVKPKKQKANPKKRSTSQGIFTPKFPEKYVGDASKIIFRSSWELRAMTFFDSNPHFLKWASEEFAIPYVKPTTGKVHKYFPDFYVEYINSKGEVIKEVIEIKPMKEVKQTKKSSAYDLVSIAINEAKWKSAVEFCKAKGMGFRVLTEHQLFK